MLSPNANEQLKRRLSALTPEQRELLRLRLEQCDHGPGAQVPDQQSSEAGIAASMHEADALNAPPAGPMSFSVFFFSDDGSSVESKKVQASFGHCPICR